MLLFNFKINAPFGKGSYGLKDSINNEQVSVF